MRALAEAPQSLLHYTKIDYEYLINGLAHHTGTNQT
tara:strand:+ start:931 stop:1038 length:108 start_codon:yes stop_codon:yes gene_type:complete